MSSGSNDPRRKTNQSKNQCDQLSDLYNNTLFRLSVKKLIQFAFGPLVIWFDIIKDSILLVKIILGVGGFSLFYKRPTCFPSVVSKVQYYPDHFDLFVF